MTDKAHVYLYQERVGENPPHRTQKVVGTEVVLEDKVVFTIFLDLGKYSAMKSSEFVTEMGRSVARQLAGRRICDYEVHPYKRFSGNCIAREDFFNGEMAEKIPEDKLFEGDDVIGHMQQGFLKGLCLDDKEAYGVLWNKTYPPEKKE